MAAEYQIAIKNQAGQLLTFATDYISLKYTLKLNDVGVAYITLPYAYSRILPPITSDVLIEISRRPIGSSVWLLEGNTRWFVRKKSIRFSAGQWLIDLYCESAMTALNRRITAYFAGDSQVSITNVPADNAIKQMIRDNFTAASSSYRDWSSAIFSVGADLSLAPNISKAFAWRNCLVVAQEMAEASAEAGTYLFFDVTVAGDGLFFQTYPNYRGTDHRAASSQPVIFDPQLGNISELIQTNDYSGMASVVYSGGGGVAASRTLAQYKDDALIGYSPYGRIEYFKDARNTSDTSQLASDAKQDLQSKIPLNTFNATLQDTPNLQYGVDYYFGDLVTGRFLTNQYDCMIDTVAIDTGSSTNPEKIDVKLEGTLTFNQVSVQV